MISGYIGVYVEDILVVMRKTRGGTYLVHDLMDGWMYTACFDNDDDDYVDDVRMEF